MRVESCRLSFIVVVGCLSAGLGFAGDENGSLPVLKTKVKTVAAFKNGLSFVLRAGETPLKDGWARMDQLPPATLGTLWIGTTSKSGPVTDVIAYKEKVSADAEAITIGELLGSNVGKQVAITYLSGTVAQTAEGTLLSVPGERKADDSEISPAAPSPYVSYSPYPRVIPESVRAEIVLLRAVDSKGKSSVLAINKSSIQSLQFTGEASLRTSLQRELARTKVRVVGNPSQAEITVACLEKGILWSPSYRINLANEKEAQIELEAVLANDMEDLDNAEVSFVVGYPNFAFAEVLSPMSLQQTVSSFVQALTTGRGATPDRFGNVMAQSVMYNTARFEAASGPDASYSALQPMAGEQNEDLFLYQKLGVTMKKGDRARFTIFNTSVPYEHIYQWEIPDSMNVDDRGYRLNAQAKPENQVWHVLRLENKGQQPWTTAPAFALNGALPVAQDTLTYTPPGGRSTLKLTVAADVRGEQTQAETDRKQVSIAGHSYDEVTVSGKLRLASYKNKEVSMLVRKSLVGQVLESPDGKVSKIGRNLTSVNANSEIEWEFKLSPGKDRELTYQYKALLAR